ncbi:MULTISPECIES: MarR family winged helix-turn-helix transcriptional regulator [Subtercola]|uniref:MarR family transcriptional regulator n=1 Tax=Subtercola vilae TaxID=2056433 RepID=A0A4V4RDP0_9MICO|nr:MULTISPECIES: MarR family transcriptional regulator [Subtercola]MEA9985838.1 MarR family transcriptional regulator [Subtercola sp. RTI3]TIH30824.1 MarR family transcriptional regulator [Subtercola vilae]
MTVDLERLGRSLKRVQHRDHRALDAALRETGISLVQWDALRAIDRAPGSSAHALAAASFQSDQAFGTLASRLVSAGYIERRPGPGRRIEHHLTTDGHDALDAGRRATDRVWRALFGSLDSEQRMTLQLLLDRLLASEPGDDAG